MNPVLLSGLVVAGAFWACVELFYWLDHKPRMRDDYDDLCEQLDVPDVLWLETLLEIRGLQDTRKRSLVYDWEAWTWVEE